MALEPRQAGPTTEQTLNPSTESAMKRLLALIVCALVAGGAITSCGGGADLDKLTIVGAGS